MEGDSAFRGYRNAQINRFESQLLEINLLHKESFVINICHQSAKRQSSTTQILENNVQFSRSWRPGRSITVEVYYRPLSTLQTALWENGNFVLCNVFLF